MKRLMLSKTVYYFPAGALKIADEDDDFSRSVSDCISAP
jgi:hypothetical protein